jgi:peptidoglycan/LPS O-acetylase OafA/YrhL
VAVGRLSARALEQADASSAVAASAGVVPDAVAPPPDHPRFALFDGLRAIAVLCVLVGHVPGSAQFPDPLPRLFAHLNLGVVIFFVISGFLLYRPFIAARGGGGPRPPVGDYGKRRFLRIFPAYWLVLTVLTVLPWTGGVADGNPAPQYALVHTLPVLGGPACPAFSECGLAQTWSLVAELSFYAVLPLYALVGLWLTRDLKLRLWMWVQLGILAVLSILFGYLHFGPLSDSLWISSTVLGFWLWFALGMGLAVASVALEGAARPPTLVRLVASNAIAAWLLAAVAYVVLSLSLPVFTITRAESVANFVGLGLVAFLIVVPGVFVGRHGLPRAVLGHPLVAWIGLISYGIFLWHFAIAHELGPELPYGLALVVTLALSVVVAAASYYLVERPILRFKYRRFRDLLSPALLNRQNETGV